MVSLQSFEHFMATFYGLKQCRPRPNLCGPFVLRHNNEIFLVNCLGEHMYKLRVCSETLKQPTPFLSLDLLAKATFVNIADIQDC